LAGADDTSSYFCFVMVTHVIFCEGRVGRYRGLTLVLSVGSAASLSQQRNKGAQAVFTQEESTPEHHADVDGKQDLAEE
jgi:hypothetical protein